VAGRLRAGGIAVLVLLVVVGGLGPAVRALRRRRRYAGARDDADRVQVVWAELEDALSRAGLAPTPADTPRELAARAVRSGAVPVGLLEPMARDVTTAQWDPDGVGPDVVTEVQRILAEVEAELTAPLSRRDRFLLFIDPRTHRRPAPSSRQAVDAALRARRERL
jgi:hypothetical protein